MEQYDITVTDNEIFSPNFPNAEKIIQIDDHPLAQRLADLSLHRDDILFAEQCLGKINLVPDPIIQHSLFFSASICFYKCFGNNKSRFSLDQKKIYRKKLNNGVIVKDSDGLEIFEFYKNVRNKHLVHDENSLSECITGAVLNKKTPLIK